VAKNNHYDGGMLIINNKYRKICWIPKLL